ncbi:MAG: diguanylate cyclase [Hahellaceae bacterium]|nr:diguanylate cyclase [Hahellaceae bacterium]
MTKSADLTYETPPRVLLIGLQDQQASLTILEPHFSLTYASTLTEALGTLQKHTVDIVLVNFSLPDQTGVQCCHQLRHASPWSHLPVIMFGHNEAIPQLIEAYDRGASDCYFTTSDLRELINKIHSQLTLTSLRTALNNSLEREEQILEQEQQQWELTRQANESDLQEDKQRILIVDDSVASIEILDTILANEYDLYFATTGADALRIGRDVRPHLIMLDVMLPDTDGYTLCESFKRLPGSEDTPVVFVTSLDSADDEAKGLAAGAIDYIVKPYRPSIVKARARNLLELVHNRDLLKKLSLTDALTQIPNRRSFEELFRREWFRACRHSETLVLMMIDIDNFKKYNDRYGHPMGDQCLISVANALYQSRKRSTDYVARMGGEEFVVLLANTTPDTARQFAQSLIDAVRGLNINHEDNEGKGRVTVSVGLQLCRPVQTQQREHVLNQADEQLYLAKSRGRDQLAFGSEVSQTPPF